MCACSSVFFFFQAEDGIRDLTVTGVQTCALPISFGGYASFWRANRLMRLMRLPRWVAAAAQATGRGLTRWTRDWGRQVSKAARLAHAGRADSAGLLARPANYLSRDPKRALGLPAAPDRAL